MSTSVTGVTTNYFPSAENGFTTTTSGSVSSGAATVGLNSVAGYTNGEIAVFVIDPTDASKKQTFTGVIDTAGVQVTSVVWTAGTNQSHALGATVVDYATATHISMMTKGILVEHNQDGTHGALTADSVSTTDLTVTNSPTFTIGGALYKRSIYYTYDGTDIFVDGVDQNNAANTINWTKPTGLRFVVVEVQGGGGAGGGAAATSGSQYSGGAGGGGGCYALKKVVAASLGSTETVTVGAAGAGGTGTGGNGGNSSFGSHCTANGGTGGAAQGAITSTTVSGSTGGNGSSTGTGDFVQPGQGGQVGTNIASHNNGYMSGGGGNSRFGSGGKSNFANNSGQAGSGYGAGGGAASNALSQSARNGGNGSAGIVIVHEYY